MVRSSHRLAVGEGTALYMGAVLGPGVLVLPALAARAAGPASVLAWLGLLTLSVPVALAFAVLGARYPDGGGVSNFVGRAFGHWATGPVGWWFFFGGVPVGVLAGALVGGHYVAYAAGLNESSAIAIACTLLLAAFLVNAAGLHISSRIQLMLVGLLVALLSMTILLSAPHVQEANFIPFAPHGWWAIGHAATVLFYAFSGWEAVSHLSAEFSDPQRQLHKIAVSTLVMVAVLYTGLALATTGVLGAQVAASEVPLMLLLEGGIGSSGRIVTATAAVLLTFGAINAYIAGGARLGAALARDGALPRWLDTGTLAGQIPRRSVAALATLCTLLTAVTVVYSIDLDTLMRITSVCLAAVTMAGTMAALKLIPRSGLWWCIAAGTVFAAAVFMFCGLLIVIPIALGTASTITVRILRRCRLRASSDAIPHRDSLHAPIQELP
ncbi:MAG: APC family permease [Candidatus Dormibacteraceae bacterium]